MHCAAHPNVETELRCGKCETPICPRCMVQTPVGARCRACANLRRPVIYTTSPALVLRALAAGIGLAVAVGAAVGYLISGGPGIFGFFVIFPAAGYGWLAAQVVSRAAKNRRGPTLQVIAAASCVIAYMVYGLVSPHHALIPRNDLYGYVFAGLSAVVAVGYLR
jgi:hypothetical protein